MKVSIIIPTFNKSSRLNLTLLSLTHQNFLKSDFEVVIVDDGSTDKTKEVVSSFIHNEKLRIQYYYQINKGRSAARNKGINLAKGDLIIFLDDDRIVEQNFISGHVSHYKTYNDKFVVLGKRMNVFISNFEKNYDKILHDFRLNSSSITKYGRAEYYWNKITRAQHYQNIKWIMFTTGNTSVMKKYLTECGMFNELFYGWGMEDTELGYKLWNHGLDMIMDDSIINYHIEHKRNTQVMLADEERNHRLFYQLHKNEDVRLYIAFVHGQISLEQFYQKVSGKKTNTTESTYYLKHTKPFQFYIKS